MGKKRERRQTLRTLRLGSEESRLISAYLKKNPVFENFSALARAALLSFIQTQRSIDLRPAHPSGSAPKPSFMWDYDLSKDALKQLLRSSDTQEKRAFIAKILLESPFEEIWEYLTLDDIRTHLPYLRMPEKIKKHWELALHVWKK